MYNDYAICDSFLTDIQLFLRDYINVDIPYYVDEWSNRMGILFSVANNNGIVLSCDSKIICSQQTSYVNEGIYYSDEKVWFNNEGIGAVCCGGLGFANLGGYTRWKEILEEAIEDSKYTLNQNFTLLGTRIIDLINNFGVIGINMIVANGKSGEVLVVRYDPVSQRYCFVVNRIEHIQPFYFEAMAYTPINAKSYLSGRITNIMNYSLEELCDLCCEYINDNIGIADKIASRNNKEAPIGGNVQLLLVQKNGFIRYRRMPIPDTL